MLSQFSLIGALANVFLDVEVENDDTCGLCSIFRGLGTVVVTGS